MIRNRLLLICALTLMLLASCSSKEERVINNLKNLSERVEKHAQDFDLKEWEEVAKEYNDLHEQAADCDFTKEELVELSRVEGKLTVAISKGASKSLIENGEDIVKGFVEGISEGL